MTDMAMASEELVATTPRGRQRSRPSELAAARDELLPALERLLAGYSPATRLALLNELQARGISDLESR